jgi:hypothetical protein
MNPPLQSIDDHEVVEYAIFGPETKRTDVVLIDITPEFFGKDQALGNKTG